MPGDQKTYGFNANDADALLQVIESPAKVFGEWQPLRMDGRAVFLTPSGGIPARSGSTLGSASCQRMTVAGGTRAPTDQYYTVYNDFLSAVSGSVDIVALKINGIWVVVAEDCP